MPPVKYLNIKTFLVFHLTQSSNTLMDIYIRHAFTTCAREWKMTAVFVPWVHTDKENMEDRL